MTRMVWGQLSFMLWIQSLESPVKTSPIASIRKDFSLPKILQNYKYKLKYAVPTEILNKQTWPAAGKYMERGHGFMV